jgi:histone-binding protein RBBP4
MKPGKNSLDFENVIPHQGVVYKARASYNSFNIIATKSEEGRVHIFDFSQHGANNDRNQVNPQMVLLGHETEGWGLDWSMIDHNLISGDDKGRICTWDLIKSPLEHSEKT